MNERTRFDRTQFDALRDLVERQPMARGIWHGSDHWMHEAMTAMELADRDPRVDRALVLIFTMIHDTHRLNERHDPDHGQRAADFARSINDSILRLSPERLEVLVAACVEHDRGKTTEDPTIGAMWDADRLQLERVGITPDPRLLSTAAAPDLIEEATADLKRRFTWDDVYERYLQAFSPS